MINNRKAPIEITKDEFKRIGYQLIDTISNFIDTIDEKPVTTGETPKQIQNVLGNASLPEHGTSVLELFSKTTDLLLNHSLLNGHPKFFWIHNIIPGTHWSTGRPVSCCCKS